jgi:hypothetical protein
MFNVMRAVDLPEILAAPQCFGNVFCASVVNLNCRSTQTTAVQEIDSTLSACSALLAAVPRECSSICSAHKEIGRLLHNTRIVRAQARLEFVEVDLCCEGHHERAASFVGSSACVPDASKKEVDVAIDHNPSPPVHSF